MSNAVSTLQDFPWEESIQAVKDSLRFHAYPAFAEHVFHTLPQNSPQTRRRYANLIELGSRETGKTYTFRNTSSRFFVISGGKDVVFFDEIASTSFTDPEATISVLKDYMQTGRFSRGPLEFTAQASIVLGGNIDTDLERREPSPRYRHYFEILPPELQDPAFLDRIHAFLPGWEMPKVRPENYATGYGFITDYMAEIFTRLRRHNYQTHVAAHVDFGNMTGRNQDAVKKTTAGLLKLVFPHRTAEDLEPDELNLCLSLATECRQRVLDQLAVMLPEEFGGVRVEVATR
jgi:ATP-dependent Lon protease